MTLAARNRPDPVRLPRYLLTCPRFRADGFALPECARSPTRVAPESSGVIAGRLNHLDAFDTWRERPAGRTGRAHRATAAATCALVLYRSSFRRLPPPQR